MQTRDTRGRYSTKTKVWFYVLLTLSCLIIAHATYTQSARANEVTVEVPEPPVTVVDTVTPHLEQKIEELKSKLVAEMHACENKGNLPAWHDNNSKGTLSKRDAISYGPLAYKIPTLQDHYKQIYGKTLTDTEAATFAMSEDVKPFAVRVWLEIPGSVNHWSCATPEMKRRIEDIRFLTQ